MTRRRKGSKQDISPEPVPVEDWAALYGQPSQPRTLESYEKEWSHWNVQPEPATKQQDIDFDSESAPSEPECVQAPIEAQVRLRRKRRSKSGSPLKEDRGDQEKRYSRVPIGEDSNARQTILLGITFIVIIATLLACGLFYTAAETTILRVVRPNHMPTFEKKIQELKQLFPSQPAHNWAIIRSAFAEVLNNSNYDYGPATLVILASRKDQQLASCFAEKLALSLSKSFHPTERPIVMNGAKLMNSRDSIAAKHTIDNSVKDRDNFVMQFTSLEQIDSYTASIFHSLCDYYNSPFKDRAVFIFTVHTTEDVEGKKRKEYDEIADRTLNEAWDELDINKRSALIARLTGSTILLKKEPRRVC